MPQAAPTQYPNFRTVFFVPLSRKVDAIFIITKSHPCPSISPLQVRTTSCLLLAFVISPVTGLIVVNKACLHVLWTTCPALNHISTNTFSSHTSSIRSVHCPDHHTLYSQRAAKLLDPSLTNLRIDISTSWRPRNRISCISWPTRWLHLYYPSTIRTLKS